jgi:hypothetical protein
MASFLSLLQAQKIILGLGNLNNNNALALVFKSGQNVKIFSTDNSSIYPVEVSALEDGESVVDAYNCQSASTIKSYWGSRSKYEAALKKKVPCLMDRLDATVASAKVSNIQTSIDNITKIIPDVQDLLTALEKPGAGESFDGLIIPVYASPSYPYAKDVAIRCIKRGSEVSIPEIAVGSGKYLTGSVYVLDDDTTEAEMSDLKEKNKNSYARVKPYQDANQEWPADIKEEISDLATDLMGKIKSRYTGILPGAGANYSGTKISLGFSIEKDKVTKQPVDCTHTINSVKRFVAKTMGISGPFYYSTIVIDGLSYNKICLPVNSLVNMVKTELRKTITDLTKLKAQYVGNPANKKIGELGKAQNDLNSAVAAFNSCSN